MEFKFQQTVYDKLFKVNKYLFFEFEINLYSWVKIIAREWCQYDSSNFAKVMKGEYLQNGLKSTDFKVCFIFEF